MYAAKLAVGPEEFNLDEFDERLDPSAQVAWTATAYSFLDGAAEIIEGDVVVTSVEEVTVPRVTENRITTEDVNRTEKRDGTYVLDPEGWMGVDTSQVMDAVDTFGLLFGSGNRADGGLRPARINLDAFAHAINGPETYFWLVGWGEAKTDDDEQFLKEATGEGRDDEADYHGASATYHDDAYLSDKPPLATYNQIGFRTMGEKRYRGLVCASGWVALFDTDTAADYGRFVREHVLPHAHGIDHTQITLDEVSADE